jgi:hypothetical protein
MNVDYRNILTREEIPADFPYLTDEDIRACLAYAADREARIALSRHRATHSAVAVTLLFAHNLSPRLVTMMADIFPGSAHVSYSAGTGNQCGE